MKRVAVLDAEQQSIREQQELNKELMKKLSALEAEVNRLGQSSADGRLARLVN